MTAEQAQQTLAQMKKALAAGGETDAATPAAFSKKLENAQQKGYTENNYWYPNLTKSELGNLHKLVRSDVKTSTNNINERANWYSTRIDGQPVFAIYSTADASNPTILYAEKGAQAIYERAHLADVLEVIENGKSFDGQSSASNTVFNGSWVQQGRSYLYDDGAVVGRNGTGNVGVLQEQSQRKPSAAFKSVLRNIFEVRESDGAAKYSRKLTEQSRNENSRKIIGNAVTEQEAAQAIANARGLPPGRFLF